jgi:hypothetical protein
MDDAVSRVARHTLVGHYLTEVSLLAKALWPEAQIEATTDHPMPSRQIPHLALHPCASCRMHPVIYAIVYVLQGGAAAWQEAGHPWTTAVVQPPHTTFVARPRPAMRATKAQVLKAVHDRDTTILETRRQQNIVEAGGTVQGAFWLPSTTVYASQGAYRDLISEAELDGYLHKIGADRAASLVAT